MSFWLTEHRTALTLLCAVRQSQITEQCVAEAENLSGD